MLLVSSRRVWRRGYYRIGRGNRSSSKRLWWSWARNGWSSLNWLVVIQKVEWLNFLLHKMIFNKLKVFFIKIKTIKTIGIFIQSFTRFILNSLCKFTSLFGSSTLSTWRGYCFFQTSASKQLEIGFFWYHLGAQCFYWSFLLSFYGIEPTSCDRVLDNGGDLFWNFHEVQGLSFSSLLRS